MITDNYRGTARRLLKNAQTQLATGDNNLLPYAALDLRMAMEAITYDRAKAYKEELPPKEYDTWQPSKVMQLLIDIEPSAGSDSTLAFGIEEEYGVPAPTMEILGTDKVLGMADLRKHYNALGNFLHVPTIGQGKLPPAERAIKCRVVCFAVVKVLEDVLSSKVFNATFGNFAEIDCQRCGKVVRKRVPHGSSSTEAKCHECGAEYLVTEVDSTTVDWTAKQYILPCAKPECSHKIAIWPDQYKAGAYFDCPSCGSRNVLAIGVFVEAADGIIETGLGIEPA